LLAVVSRTYASGEEDRYLLERSLDLSSRRCRRSTRTCARPRRGGSRSSATATRSVWTALSDGLCVLDDRGAVLAANARGAGAAGGDEAES
jgi:hypothetical protein